MALNHYVISISSLRKDVHVVAGYYAENPIVAAYIVAENEIGIDFDDNEDRENFTWDEVESEFCDYDYSIRCIQVN